MSGDRIIIGNKKYRLNRDYFSYGVDKEGKVIDITTREPVDVDQETMTIRLKKYKCKGKTMDIVRFVWETYNGVKPSRTTIIHLDGDKSNYSIKNLDLRKGKKRKYSSDEEREEQRNLKFNEWRKKEWVCPCGKTIKNNSRSYHKRVCPLSEKPYSDADKQRRKKINEDWKNRLFKCKICNREYKNGYKYLHTAICEKKNRCVRQRSH